MRARLDQAAGQRGQRHDGGELPDRVAPPVPYAAGAVTRRRVSQSANRPTGILTANTSRQLASCGQRAAQHRAGRGGQAADTAPQADRPGPPGPVRVTGLQQRERGGHQQRGGQALNQPDANQHGDIRG